MQYYVYKKEKKHCFYIFDDGLKFLKALKGTLELINIMED